MIQFIPETGSTNTDLATRIRGGEAVAEGFWLVADRQSTGKGRLGRVWHDGAGNFMGSTVVRPGFGDPPAPTLALAAGLAVQSVVATLLPSERRALLKWPNDLLIGHAKMAGILLESCGEAVIVGIGVNLVSVPDLPERAVVSLADLGLCCPRDDFAPMLARAFDLELERWRTFGLEPLVPRWIAAAHPAGTLLSVNSGHETPLCGTFAGLTPDGALQLRLANGTCHTIHAGEVSLAEQD